MTDLTNTASRLRDHTVTTYRLTRDEALAEIAAANKEGRRPYLHVSDLYAATLRGTDLRDANLLGSTLSGADLDGADLRSAGLNGASLRFATLRGADLRGADLREANLSGADLSGANLSGANLRGATLHGANLRGLFMSGLPSGSLIFIPTPDGWHLTIGCWEGTLDSLRLMLDGPDENWPEARGEERARRETILRPVLAMCEAFVAAHPDTVPDLAERWGES